jgi:hypothetical protein
MQATITYLLTEQAQRDAIRATGSQVRRRQTRTINVGPDDLDLFPIDANGFIELDLTGSIAGQWREPLKAAGWAPDGHTGIASNQFDFPFIEDYRRGLALLAARDAEQKALEEANGQYNQALTERAFQHFLNDPNTRASERISDMVEDLTGEELKAPASWFPSDHAGFVSEIKRRRALEEEARKAAARAKEDAEAAKAKFKTEYIDNWIAQVGSAEIKKQHEDGLLARADALRLIADREFEFLAIPPAHKVHLCQDEECPCGNEGVDGLPPAVYTGWAAQLLDLIPDGIGATVEFEKSRDCLRDPDGYHEPDNDGAGKPYYTALIKLPLGPFVFQRRVKIS